MLMNVENWPSPYYAVIFSSQRSGQDTEGYRQMSERMTELASRQPGYLGMESYRNADGAGVTISYWENEEAIRNWKSHWEHLRAQTLGKKHWYEHYRLQICKVERAYDFQY